MERLGNPNKRTGITVTALRTWGMLFLAAGVISRGLIQNHLLGFTGMDPMQMLSVLESSKSAMGLVTISIALQALETCAAPIFAILLVEGVQRTSSFRNYFLRVFGLALLTEIPYNMAVGQGILDFGSRNPVFALVLGMLLIYFYRRYSAKGIKNVLIRVLVTVAALLWTKMLSIHFGAPTVLLLAVLWALRTKPGYRNFAGVSAAICCCLFDPLFMLSPMGFVAIHTCNWEKGEENRLLNYLMYPAMLLAAAALGMFLL